MKKNIKILVTALVACLVTVICTVFGMKAFENTQLQRTVMTVGDQKITKQDVNNGLQKDYFTTEVTALKERSMINQ
ncbi:SurA N-terminal domain-containing protein [Lacticaseibacillus zhaodongensis]|uniref:SurA N-terminal domain-containing protein n=1 Tax=Lacticaseibacillus zhaodongensis TaxID=2668065 RepID=UPI0012D2D88B|nr:SurA N-terminal domain-containing protein [Lacticaseibacillus zhaodongensis]